MYKALASIVVVGTIAAFAVFNSAPSTQSTFLHEGSDEVTQAFHAYLAKYGKNYGTKKDMQTRQALFAQTYHKVMNHNMFREDSGYTLAINEFADITPEEYQKMLGFRPSKGSHGYVQQIDANVSVPSSKDWRKEGKVNAVKNQGQCGSCWAFSTVASIETARAIKTGKLESFSEQNLVDCSKLNHGCNGGSMDLAMSYVQGGFFSTKHPLEDESAYPYTARDGTCRYQSSLGKGAISKHVDVQRNSVSALKAAVAQGTTSVAIEADQSVFQSYHSGIIKANAGCGTRLDHGVAVVGYGSEAGTDYWIVRNSWGAGWGEQGYVRMEAKDGAGTCGIQMQPVYPVV